MRSLADDRSIVINKIDTGAEVEKQLKDENVYKNVEFTENILQDLAETINKMF